MIYVVSNQTSFFSKYTRISIQESIDIIEKWSSIQFDSETRGKDAHVGTPLSAQFGAPDKSIQIVVDWTTVDVRNYKGLLESKLIVGQNLKFDLQWLFNCGIVPLKVYDTMIAEQLIYLGFPPAGKPGGISYALNEIAMRYLGKYIDKTIRGQIIYRGLDDEVIEYAANDVVDLVDIAKKQIEICKKRNCMRALQIEMDFVPVIAYLEWCGIKLDINKWKAKMTKDENNRRERLEKLNDFLIKWYQEKNGKDNMVGVPYVISSFIKEHIQEPPPSAKPMSRPYKKEGNADDLFQDYSIPFYITNKSGKIIPFIKVDLQGDLFSGFNTDPQCVLNWDSSDQVIYFCQLLGFNTKVEDKTTGEDKDSVVEKALKVQKGINDEFLKLYFDYKEASKVCSTYGQTYLNAINPNTGRIHTNFKQLGASSGRMACGSKQNNEDLAKLKHAELAKLPAKLRKCGYPQLQNLPADHDTRGAFVPEKGNLMCSCDYSALESRLGADIYDEQSMIDEYLYGTGDIHSLTAKHCFPVELAGIEVKDIKEKRPDLRSRAKPVEFSQQFGGSAKAIQNALACTKAEAEAIAEAYNKGFAGIARFKDIGFKKVCQTGYVLICKHTGHRTYMPDWKEWREAMDDEEFWTRYDYLHDTLPYNEFKHTYECHKASELRKTSSKWSRLALNSPTQGSGIIILKDAMANFFRWIVKNGYFNIIKICDLVHDEAVIEYPETMPEVATILKNFMEESSAKFCKKLPIPAVPEVGKCWLH